MSSPASNSARRGTVAVEFGLIAGILFTMLLGVVEIGRYWATQQSLHTLMAEALRQWQAEIGNIAGIDAGSLATACAALKTPSLATVPLLKAGLVAYSGRQCSIASGVITVQVTISYPFTFFGPLLPSGARTLTETSRVSF